MDFLDFYDFGSKLLASTVQAHPINLGSNENGESQHWQLIKGLYEGISFPVIFKQEYGKLFTDLLDTGHVSLFLISEKMKLLLEENNLTGWQIFPIKLLDKKENEIFGYHGFSITGHCDPINYEKSQIIEKRRVPHGPLCRFYKGLYIDNWDGTDFFTPKDTYGTYASKKAADVLKKNKLTNVKLHDLATYEVNVRCIR